MNEINFTKIFIQHLLYDKFFAEAFIKRFPHMVETLGEYINKRWKKELYILKGKKSTEEFIDFIDGNGYQWSYIKADYIGPSPMYTPVICFDLSGKRLAEYYCINEAVKMTGCSAEIIKQSCQDHQIHNSTYQWRYWEEDPELQMISPSMPYTDKKQIKQYDLNGNLIKIWNSISEAADALNIERTNITGVCKKRTKSAGGFVWQYIEDNSPVKYEKNYNTKHIFKTRTVLQYDLNDNFIAEYPSIKEACAAINKNKIYTSVSHISSCCRGRQKTAYGFKWKYKENNNE